MFAKEKRFVSIALHSSVFLCIESREKPMIHPKGWIAPTDSSGGFYCPHIGRAEYVRQGCHGQTGSYPWINTEENHPHHDRPAHHST